MKKTITERAIIARINRKLATECKALRTCRENSRWLHTTGRFYVVCEATNSSLDYHVELEQFAKDLGVLHRGEALA